MKWFLLTFFFTTPVFAINFNRYNSALMLLVKKQDQATYVCSSVAITPNKLLTAAHCLDQAVSIKVVQEFKQQKENTFFHVREFYQHPHYDKTVSNFSYDIGIILLKNSLPQNINIHPSFSLSQVPQGELHRVGFGGRAGKNTRTVVFPLEEPRLSQNHLKTIDRYSFSGDSGGPIFLKNPAGFFVVGVHSTKEGTESYNPILNEETINWIKQF